MMQDRSDRLGTILLNMGVIDTSQLEEALRRQQETGERLGETLEQLKYATAEDIIAALAQKFNLPVVDPSTMKIEPELLQLVPKNLATEHLIIPVELADGRLTVATTDPENVYVQDNLRFVSGLDVDFVLATRDSIRAAIAQNYNIDEETLDNMYQEYTETDVTVGQRDDGFGGMADDDPDAAPVIKLVTLIINEAIASRASDIHVEPLADRVRVRYRVDGILHEVQSAPKRLQNSLLARIKIMSKINIAERRRPADGRIALKVQGRDIDIRVSTLPAYHGESIVMRILDKASVLLGIQDLGFSDEDYKRFQAIIRVPYGIFLVTGPTGSGKTTTLYAALSELNTSDRKIITAEDPIEYNISGLNQAQVNAEIKMTFSRILRAMLRQAPEVILVGEIRDKETAETAIQAALTGHLVFSTLHTNDAPSAITRLIDMGVPPFLVSSAVQAIMAQRLIRTICSNCKEPVEYKPFELAAVGLRPEDVQHTTLYHGAGCAECKKTGYKGRTGIFEMMEMNETLREMAFRRETYTRIRNQAIASGMTTLQQDGVRKILRGVTTIDEVLRATVAQR